MNGLYAPLSDHNTVQLSGVNLLFSSESGHLQSSAKRYNSLNKKSCSSKDQHSRPEAAMLMSESIYIKLSKQ